MPALTIDVPEKVAQALKGLPLEVDEVGFEPVLRWNVHQVHERLWEMAEGWPDIDAGELRELSRRLALLADACEAVA